MIRSSARWLACLIALLSLIGISPMRAQQKGQWMPGQVGLNAGIMPDPGITFVNIDLDYSANTLNNRNGNAVSGVTGSYDVWVLENILNYSVHSAGLQANFILPPQNLNFYFKYYWEFSAKAHPLGHTLGFGLTYTFRIPKPPPPKS